MSREINDDEGMAGFRKRAHKQFKIWKQTWVSGVAPEDKDPIFVYGHMIKYLIEPDQTPFLDLLGGGGFIPLGNNNKIIGQAIGKMANQAIQTSDKGDHIYASTAEFMSRVEEIIGWKDPAWQFASSENEAFLILMESLRDEYEKVIVINGPTKWPHAGGHQFWSNQESLTARDFASDGTAVVVYPVNPETFELVGTTTLTMLDSFKRDTNLLVWDLTVTAGWTRDPLDVNPNADAVVLGGALGGGVPMGAVVSKERLPMPSPGRWSATAGNALTMQMGLHALLQTDDRGARDRYDLLVDAVGRELETIQTMLPEVVREITGGGLLGGFRLSSAEEAYRVHMGLKDRGVLVGSLGLDRSIVTFRVSRMTDPHDVAELFDKVFEILTEEREEK